MPPPIICTRAAAVNQRAISPICSRIAGDARLHAARSGEHRTARGTIPSSGLFWHAICEDVGGQRFPDLKSGLLQPIVSCRPDVREQELKLRRKA
jgi:hypothetical protein